jgi:hypothetical protein
VVKRTGCRDAGFSAAALFANAAWHWLQKDLVTTFSAPHCGHGAARNGVPQALQNVASGMFACEQIRHAWRSLAAPPD